MTSRPIIALLLASALLSGCSVFKKTRIDTPTLGDRINVLSGESAVEADPALANVAVTLPQPEVNADWAQPGGNAMKAMGHVALPASMTPAWSVQIPGSTNRVQLAAPPVVADGRLYVVDVDAAVHAYDAASGAVLWTSSIAGDDPDVRNALFGGGVSVAGNRVFATNGAGDVAMLDASTGGIIWKVRPSGPLRGSPTLSNGHVYVMAQDNQLFALNQTDGTQIWQATASIGSGSVFGVGAPAAGQGTVVAGYSSGELYAYRYENGRDLWGDALARTSFAVSVESLTDVDASPVIDRGRVYALGKGGRMAAYELVTGQRLWELAIAGISTPWVAGEWVFVVTDQDRLLAVARTTGKVRWISQLPSYRKEESKKGAIRWTGPILAGNRLILVSTLGQMIQVNPTDGSIIGQTDAGKSFGLSPVVANNTLYLLDDEGRLTAYR